MFASTGGHDGHTVFDLMCSLWRLDRRSESADMSLDFGRAGIQMDGNLRGDGQAFDRLVEKCLHVVTVERLVDAADGAAEGRLLLHQVDREPLVRQLEGRLQKLAARIQPES